MTTTGGLGPNPLNKRFFPGGVETSRSASEHLPLDEQYDKSWILKLEIGGDVEVGAIFSPVF